MKTYTTLGKLPSGGIGTGDLANQTTMTEEKRRTFNRVSVLFHTIVCAANDVAHTEMLDTVRLLQKTKHYRHEVKKACKDALKRYGDYDRRSLEDMRSEEVDKRQLYMDFLDAVNERLKPHVFKLYMAVKQALDKRNVEESALKAHVICADQLLKYSVFLFDKFFEETPPIPPVDLRMTFLPARLHPVLSAWSVITDRLCRDCDIDLDEEPDCKLAFDIIEYNITKERYINESGMEAVSLNEELVRELDAKP
ncbi:hypothetical protein [Prevotella sp. HUN102]|uniref:hypothetical protein n=1 Tax=Prevotella sp. HUN102 TaxID=1392486 RepID=UPI00048D9AB2|nr:hypothetical protein [Prevotella sp. HUN102]